MWHVILQGKELYKDESKYKANWYRATHCPRAIVVFYNESTTR